MPSDTPSSARPVTLTRLGEARQGKCEAIPECQARDLGSRPGVQPRTVNVVERAVPAGAVLSRIWGMARFKALPPRIGTLPPRVGSLPKKADSIYASAKWKAFVAEIKRERGCWCVRCGSTKRVIGDHIVELGDGGAPFDKSNIQLLCQACHNSKTAAAKAARVGLGGSAGGGAVGPMAHPAWFRPVHVPLTLVCGPPGAGKSTWVRNRAAPGDLVICMDTIAREYLRANRRVALAPEQVGDVLRLRNEMLGDLMRRSARGRWPHAWLIALEPEARWRAWWRDTVKPARVIVLATPAEECKRRVAADAAAGDARSAAAPALIDQWWSSYTPSLGDTLAF